MIDLIKNDDHFILISLLITVCMQMSFFAIAYTLKFDKVTDLAGTSNFAILALLTLWLGGDLSFPKILASFMVVLWSVRLGTYLFYRILVWGEDKRFDEIRSKFWSFLGFWIYQILWVFILSLPITYFNSLENEFKLEDNYLSYVGLVLFFIGFEIEIWADAAKFKHKQKGENWCTAGPWKYSRHPNYFGNILLWIGIFLFCYSGGVPLWTVVGVLWITFLLFFVSGINLLEDSSNKKYGDNPEYHSYKSQTSIFIPLPNSLYCKIPESIRRTLLLDFRMYNKSQ